MKILLFLLPFAVAGCQSTPPPAQLPQPPPMPETRPPVPALVPPRNAALEQKVRQQAQYIEALVSQNDALAAKLATGGAPVSPHAAPAELPATTPPTASPVAGLPDSFLLPNADGVVDLAAAANPPKGGEQINPFVLRATGTEPAHEVKLLVSGILAGARPCALINERLISVGESVESLVVERIEDSAVVLRHDAGRIRLPVSDQPVRVRLPL